VDGVGEELSAFGAAEIPLTVEAADSG